jgi:hypothetical protein
MGYSMKMGSKQINSPSAFSMKQSAMMMHHDGKIISIDTDKKVEKLPPKEGYITGGKKITRTTTTRRGHSSSIPGPSGSKEFNIAFGEASRKGLKTFPFKGSDGEIRIYTTEKAPNRKKSAVSVEKNTIVSTMGGIKANPINIKAPVLDKKVPKPNKIIIPPAPIKRKRKPFRPLGKKPFGRPGYKRGAITKIVRGAGEGIGTAGRIAGGITLGAVTLPFRAARNLFSPKCKGGGCPHVRTNYIQKLRRKNSRKRR